jgi:hypothetical protein
VRLLAQPTLVFNGFDLLWMGIAVYAAWRICRAPIINIAGPFPISPRRNDGLQFHTVEPVAPPAPPEQP